MAMSEPVRCPRCKTVILGGPAFAVASTISQWPILCPSCATVIPEFVSPVQDQGRPDPRYSFTDLLEPPERRPKLD
jgi:hypothetical protein